MLRTLIASRPTRELALLGLAVSTPILPIVAALPLIGLVAALWWRWRPPHRERWALLGGLAAAALALSWSVVFRPPVVGSTAWHAEATGRYQRLVADLESAAATAAAAVETPVAGDPARRTAFAVLGELAADSASEATFLLVDSDGQAIAWDGPGLLHEPRAAELPRSGFVFWTGFGSATLAAVAPTDASRRPWRVLVGRSFSAEHLPFPDRAETPCRWSLLAADETAPPGTLVLTADPAPRLVVLPPADGRAEMAGVALPRRVAAGFLAAALVVLAAMRGVGLVLLAGTALRSPSAALGGLAILGAVAAGIASDLAGVELAILAAGAALAVTPYRRHRVGGGWLGGIGVLLLVLAASGLQARLALPDLATAPFSDAAATAMRLAFAGAAMGVLRAAAAGRATVVASRWIWSAVGATCIAAASLDIVALGLPALVAGGVLAGRWSSGRRVLRQGGAAAGLVIVSALVAATAWELAHRFELRRQLGRSLPQMARLPDDADLSRLGERLDQALGAADFATLAPRDPSRLLTRDLAFQLWLHSPLARGDLLSAVRVIPEVGPAVVFSYGVPLAESGELDRRPERWQHLPAALGRWPMVQGARPLYSGGALWGAVEYWALPLPGFGADLDGDPAAVGSLLRGEPRSEMAGPLAGIELLMLDESGKPLLVPWEEPPPPPPSREAPNIELQQTPYGLAWAVSRRSGQETVVLYLPFLAPHRGFERVGGHAVGALLPLVLLVLVGALVSLPRAAFRSLLAQSVRSYSKRLLVVFTLVLLLPLLILNLVLVATLAERLRDQQRAAGEATLHSAQHVLSEYVATLEPGFGLDTTIDDELMDWLSMVVRHELNVYWGSSLYASSKRELFTAHLLPERIPGDVYSLMVLGGGHIGSRLNSTGDATYLELYAPLEVPGSGTEGRLFLSMPLLAQEEESAAEISNLRRQALLVTIALFVVLVAIGSRLARNFTQPLAELVEGTRRIAEGASSVGLAPTELELAALVEAVDDMAARIAEGRARLVDEKQLVDTVVESITSAVVSVDGAGRVVMRNRVAAELLGVEVGEELGECLGRDPRLDRVARFVGEARDELAETTERLRGADGDEEREWRLLWVPIGGAGTPTALLVVEDATEVLRGQRLTAWAEMARIIAHEIKNPLTPIRLSTEHLQEVYRRDPAMLDGVLERCTANILKQVEELRAIAAEFSTYSHIPRLDRRPGDLARSMRELVEGYLAAPPPGVEVRFRASEEELPCRFDAKLLGRAVRNLLENALRASGSAGEVELSLGRDGGNARIRIADRGPGVPEELLGRIFDPYFSTHDAGTGLGLPIARRIAEEHGGAVRALNRPGGGLDVTITIPLS